MHGWDWAFAGAAVHIKIKNKKIKTQLRRHDARVHGTLGHIYIWVYI